MRLINQQTTRRVGPQDGPLIDGLIARAHWRHAHLDWLEPGDLVGSAPFLVSLKRALPVACLACPPDPPGVAWIRIFAGSLEIPAGEAWNALWPQASEAAVGLGALTAAALTTDPWMTSLLIRSGFAESNRVVFLEHAGGFQAPEVQAGVRLRAFRPSDQRALCEVDQQAFGGLWSYSRTVLDAALAQAASVTVLEAEGAIAGYQLSTASAQGAHLARLAVRPELQGRGYGRTLVEHVLCELGRRGVDHVSVNTQADNAPSLRLYRRLGFRETGQSYPVLTLPLAKPAAIPGSRRIAR